MKKKHPHYHKDGSIWAKGFMNGSKMDGAWVWFRKPASTRKGSPTRGRDGSKMRSGTFKLGKQTGVWVTYNSKGGIVKKTKFK